MSDDSEQGDTVEKSDKQKKGTEEQLMSDASEQGDTVEKSDEQKKGTEEQSMSDASEQGDTVEKSDEQKKGTEEQLMPDASQKGDTVEKSDEQKKGTEEQLMPDASEKGDAVEKSDEQQKEIEEQTKERIEEQLMPDASQEGDPVKKSKEQRKEIKEKLILEASQQRDEVKTSEEQKKDTTEQLMPEASEQRDVVKKSEEQKKEIEKQKKETEVKSKPKASPPVKKSNEKENDKETNEEKSISSAREEEDSGLGSEAASPTYEDDLMEMAVTLSSDSSDDETLCVKEAYGTGLRNEAGEYNCFLNVIIQSLWHLKWFRNEFMEKSFSEHAHVGNQCVICALYSIFLIMTMESSTSGAVAPTPLRVAVSNLHPGRSLFKVGEMNDASELLVEILDCLHKSSDPPCTSLHESSDPTYVNVVECLAHSIFGLNLIRKTHCEKCKLELPDTSVASYFHLTNATALRDSKAHHPDESFEERLKRDTMEISRYCCQPEDGGCWGGMSFTEVHIASSPPHVFTVVVGWQSIRETAKDIKDTIDLVSTEIDVGVVYHIDGLALSSRYYLVSVVCYEGMHYICFVYDHDHAQWMLYNDQSVKVIGSWKDVVALCVRRMLQPQVLFYEAGTDQIDG